MAGSSYSTCFKNVSVKLNLLPGRLAVTLFVAFTSNLVAQKPTPTEENPFQTWKDRTIMVFSPHPDDDIIGSGGALAFLAAACIVAGKLVVPQETHVEERDPLLEEEEAEEVVEMVEAGGEGISRRKLLAGAGGVAVRVTGR